MVLNRNVLFPHWEIFDWSMAIQIWLSSNTFQNNFGLGRCILNINKTSLKNIMKVNTSRTAWLKAVYSASAVINVICVCSLLIRNTRHPAYIIIYLVYDMRLFWIVGIYLSQSTGKIRINIIFDNFFFVGIIYNSVCR